jgi:periplasmic protein TonB
VAPLNNLLTRFFALSLTIHLLVLLMWPASSRWLIDATPIAVSLLPQSESNTSNPQDSGSKRSAVPRQAPTHRSEAATRPSNAPAKVAKKNSPAIPETSAVQRELPAPKEPNREELRPSARERIPDNPTVIERPLPSVKELLPPFGWSGNPRARRGDGPIDWDTKNPQYVTYFNAIKRAIETVWQYPELALKYGLQGKLTLEFSILGNGDLEAAKIVRSSGSNLLDEEALRAVKAAAPFGPIPPWIGRNRIEILASFEYLDNRLNYRFMP